MINYKGIDEAVLLKALHDNTQPLGMGWLHAKDLTLEDAEADFAFAKAGNDHVYFDYYHGRPLKVEFNTVDKTFDGRLYDRDAGEGMADAVVASIYASLPGERKGITMTIQEMFDKAVRGLAGQDWRKSVIGGGGCLYHSPNGDRCAWGHVDPEGTKGQYVDLNLLALRRVGLAGQLTNDELIFAEAIQHAHDAGPVSEMPIRFKRLGERYGLAWPEGC